MGTPGNRVAGMESTAALDNPDSPSLKYIQIII